MLPGRWDRYSSLKLIQILKQLEEEFENRDLIKQFEDRFDTPLEEFIKMPDGLTTLEYYHKRKQDSESRGKSNAEYVRKHKCAMYL